MSAHLPKTLILIGALTVLMSFTCLGLGLLVFRWLPNAGTVAQLSSPPAAPAVTAAPAAQTKPDAEPAAPSLPQRVEQARTQARLLETALDQQHARLSSLTAQESELARVAEQRRSALRQAQDAVHAADEQQQRLANLRAQAADLDRRIAALRSRLEAADKARLAGQASTAPLAPQFVDCVQGAVILEPQHVRISSAAMNNGVLASIAKQRGIYFLVRSTGFESFIAARSIARAANGVVGYEPKDSGGENAP